jgi:hypothetical protein
MHRTARLLATAAIALPVLLSVSARAQSPDGQARQADGGAASEAQAAVPDTPERRAQLAQQLVDLQWPETKRSIIGMVQGYENLVPPDQRPEFRANFDRLFDFEQVRRYSALAIAKDLTAEEIGALVDFYGSPLGHSAMTKMPQVMQDTIPFVQTMLMNTLKQMPDALRPPPSRNL